MRFDGSIPYGHGRVLPLKVLGSALALAGTAAPQAGTAGRISVRGNGWFAGNHDASGNATPLRSVRRSRLSPSSRRRGMTQDGANRVWRRRPDRRVNDSRRLHFNPVR